MNELTKSFVDKVAERIVGLLKEGTAPWQKPWQAGEADGLMPTNPVTGNRYKGINALHLMCQDREDQRWMTYKQAESIGAQVRQGEKGTPIQYWKFSEEHTKTDQNDQPVLDADGKQVKHTVRLERPALYMATVFNAAQIDGLPPPQRRSDQQNPAWSPIERAEGILQASGATVRHSNQDQAFYRAQTDTIHLPEKGQFAQPDQYYAVALHELGHWTGHESRLGRDMNHPFGSEGYAREELRAEIASMILGDELGVGHDPKQHAAYVGAWIKAIEDDPLEIFRAAADAEKIQEYVLGIVQKQQQEQQQEQTLDDEAQQVADFLAANKNLLPGKVAQNALAVPPPLRAILADAAKMKALDPKVDALLLGMNQVYIDETKAVVAATLGRADTKELAEAAQMARAQMPDGAKHDLDDAELVADFIARNLNLTPDKVADNALQAPAALKAILSDNERMAALDGQVNTLLQNLNQAYIDETQSVIASALNRSDAPERQDRARQSWAMRPEFPGNDSDDAQLIADFISANVNLYPDKVAANMMEASSAVKSLMQDDRRIDALWGQVTALLDGVNPDYVAQTAAVARKASRDTALTSNVGQGGGEVSMNNGDQVGVDESNTASLPAWRGSLEVWLGAGGMAVADARKALNGSVGAERDMASAAFLQTVEDVLEVDLHPDWTGEVSMLGEVVSPVDGTIVLAPPGVEPVSWKVVATNADGSTNTVDYAESEDDARDLAGTLKLIDAYAETNEYEKAAKLARVYEESVQHNPESTLEDVAVARAIRKDAEFNATRNDADLQRRISEQEKALAQAASELSDQANRVYIQVPYSEKDQAKALGARWDRQEQSWYVPPGADLASFSKYAQQVAKSGRGGESAHGAEGSEERAVDAPARQYLAVPYAERHQARSAGAEWDKGAKCWYAGQAADMSRLSKWKSDQFPGQQDPAMQPKEEFAQALRQAGCVLSGEHPVMDGKKHRITVEGEKFSEHSGSGFYVGHLDGHPAGYIKNNKTGVETHWKSKGYTLDPQQKAELRASAALKLQERGDQLASQQAQIAERVTRQMADLVPVERPTAYMRAKGLQPQPGVMTDRGGETTYVPAYDADGKQWSTQYIRDDGAKRFAKGSRKTGCFHPVGGMEALAKAPALVIAEGYATACSLAESLKHATVAAFDSGNLPLVAQALHAKFPGKPVVIAGDNDLAQQAARGHNPGREKAQEAAQLTGGKLVLPIFAPDEQVKHPAQFTDFNDLATKSALGRDGLDRQIRTAVAAEIERHEKKTQELTQELQQGHGQRRSIKVA